MDDRGAQRIERWVAKLGGRAAEREGRAARPQQAAP